MAKMELLLEAERRGILPADKKILLDEARKRGLVPSLQEEAAPPPTIEGASPWEVGQMPTPREALQANAGLVETGGTIGGMLGGARIGATVGAPFGPPAMAAGALLGGGIGYVGAKRGTRGLLDVPQESGYKDLAEGLGFAALPAAFPAAAQATKAVANRAAVSLYKHAAKYPTTLKMAEKTKLATAALREKVLFKTSSIEKLGTVSDEMSAVADEAILHAQNAGGTIETKNIKDSFWKATNELKSDPIFNKQIAESVQARFGESIDALPETMSAQAALDWRRNLNSQLTGYFEAAKKSGLTGVASAEKVAIASTRKALNDEIFTMIPELKELGKRQSEIIDLITYTEKAVSRISNWDLLGLGSLIAGGVMADVAGIDSKSKAGALAAAAGGMLAWRFIGHPNTKARIAFLLAKAGKLNTASPSTLELIGLTKESAKTIQPRLKALSAPPDTLF